jgi:hypothetical protein
MTTTKKKFDCVEMQHRGAEAVRRATQGMTREEELAYWQRGTAELVEMQRKLREAATLPATTASSSE